jgi:ectoine hydroxylase-related dioxygenase (phytanoyl-CoA dioxygenase family)
MNKYTYDTDYYKFLDLLRSTFNVYHLDKINENREVFKREEDQSTKYHKLYYELARTPEFTSLYTNFIKQIIKPIYGEQIVYQTIPTFRIAFPNNIAVGEWHKDKWYRNGEWANDVKEDNFYLPFTNAFDTNTIWVESEEDKGDFAPMNCNYGEIIQWNGSNLTHGNKINETGKARVSVDFRVIRYSNYKPSNYGSINTKTQFAIGGYYNLI